MKFEITPPEPFKFGAQFSDYPALEQSVRNIGDQVIKSANGCLSIGEVERYVSLGETDGRIDYISINTLVPEDTFMGVSSAGIDQAIWSSITWDQGSEMAGHKAFTMATNMPIYFCYPGSPWERGSNENTNGRLRRNLPKSSDLSVYSAEDLEMIANIHNHKPRKALHWRTPAEVMADALRQTGSITSN